MKENFDLILFDLDGTLTDSGDGIMKCVQYALRNYGIEENNPENLRRFIGPPLIDSFQNFYGFSKEESIEVRKVFNERYLPIGWMENHPYPGIYNVLETLKAEGKMLAVATSKPEDTANRVLEYFDLRKYFDVVCAAPKNGMNGEKVGRILAAMEEAKAKGCPARRPVMVGDTKFDVLGAHECGIPAVGVTWGYALEGEFEACHTEYTADTMEALLGILK